MDGDTWPTWVLAATSLMKPTRGFSTRFDAQLDMRMDQRQELTATDLLQQVYPKQQLHKLFEQYGEVTNSKTLARTIVEGQENSAIEND